MITKEFLSGLSFRPFARGDWDAYAGCNPDFPFPLISSVYEGESWIGDVILDRKSVSYIPFGAKTDYDEEYCLLKDLI